MRDTRSDAPQQGGDSGATLIWVAILSVVLFGITAFAVDAGLGYTVKRKLSATADSAALAGALEAVRTYSGGSCNTAAIEAAIQANHTANNPTSAALPTIGNGIEIDCDELSVTVHETSELDSIFGRILGVDRLNPRASATAQAFGSSRASGLRPFTVCLWDALRSAEDPHASGAMQASTFMAHVAGGTNDGFTIACQPTATPGSGGWAIFDERNGGGPTIVDLIANGYDGTFDVGDRQDYEGGPTGWPPVVGIPVQESPADRAATHGAPGRADTGLNANATPIAEAAANLVGNTVLLPVAEYWDTDLVIPGTSNGKGYEGFGAIRAKIQGVALRKGSSPNVDDADSRFEPECSPTSFALFAAGSGAYVGNAPETTCRDRAVALFKSDKGIKFVLFWTYAGRWTASPTDTSSPCNPADITCGWRVSLTG